MTDLSCNLSSSALRTDRYFTKAMIGIFAGGLCGGTTGILIVASQYLLQSDFLEWRVVLQSLLINLPRVWFEGTSAGIATGLFVGLISAWHLDRKFQI
jgi:hypothetical protein